MEEKVRKQLLVGGMVQGVGFRWFARQCAESCHLTGWVSNLDDGRVELEVQGLDGDVNRFVGMILRGHGFIRVMEYEEQKVPVVSGELDFQVKD